MIHVDENDLRANPETIRKAEAALVQISDYIERQRRQGSDTHHAEQLRDALIRAVAEALEPSTIDLAGPNAPGVQDVRCPSRWTVEA